MTRYYLDPSAWVKRYVRESGSGIVMNLWQSIDTGEAQGICHWLGLTEVISVLHRRRNAGAISGRALQRCLDQFEEDSQRIVWLPVSWIAVVNSAVHISRHNLNATDALHLEIILTLRSVGMPVTLVSSDRRLLRAAAAENLPTINPETAAENA